jgi:DNA-binding transcriptional ArsR family regulator
MPLARRRVTDTTALKALAHPVRIALLDLLVAEGPLTASEAADRVDASPSNCSWHLRKLAEHGFVRELRGRTGRRRPWQAVSEGLDWGDPEDGDQSADVDAPAGAATGIAADALGDMLVERELQRLRAARAAQLHEPAAWRAATGLVRSRLWLTAAEAQSLTDQLTELVSRHAERCADPDGRPPDARLVSVVGWVVPSGPTPAAAVSPAGPAAGQR